MFHLLKLEWLKLRDYTVFRVMGVLYLILLPGFFLSGLSFLPDGDLGGPAGAIGKNVIYAFPDVFKYLGYGGNWMVFFFLGFIAVISITNEFSNKTLRQNIITGMSRTDYFLSKLYFVLAISAAATIWYFLCGLVIGLFNTETIYTSAIFRNIEMVPRYFLMCVGYMSVGVLFGFVIRRTGVALFLYLAYGMFIEPLLRYAVHLQIVQHKSVHWYPMNAFEDLVPIPFGEMAEGFAQDQGFSFFLSPVLAISLSLFYLSLFFFLSWRRMRGADL